jgi:hypothetical protein
MAAAGLFGEDDRVELLEGEIVEMTPIGSRHAGCVNQLNELFSDRLQRRAVVSVQNPVRLGTHSETQPDLALLRLRADRYAGRHPGPDDVLLLVEVADTTRRWEREHKVPVYAAAGVGEVWLATWGPGSSRCSAVPRVVATATSTSPAPARRSRLTPSRTSFSAWPTCFRRSATPGRRLPGGLGTSRYSVRGSSAAEALSPLRGGVSAVLCHGVPAPGGSCRPLWR